jgi:hypothetical protein
MTASFLFYAGERLKRVDKTDWGVGQVLVDSEYSEVDVFFEYFGKVAIDTHQIPVSRVESSRYAHPVLDVLLEDLNWKRAHHNVYVVLLDRSVLNHRKFQEANRHYRGSKPCVYVGMTGLKPEARLRNHKRGHKSNLYVHKYGIRLLYHHFRNFNPMPYKLADIVEKELASRLRDLDYGVWQH